MGNRFWYRNDLAGGAREFILVEALGGSRRLAFDHARLAQALAKAAGKPVAADRLPIDDLRLPDGDRPTLAFSSDGKRWECDLRTYALRSLGDAPPPQGLRRGAVPRPSLRTGRETRITFRPNRTGQPVDIFWMDPDGRRQPYGTLQPGERRDQHTNWARLARRGPGRWILGVFEASETPGAAVIDPRPPGAPPAPPDPIW